MTTSKSSDAALTVTAVGVLCALEGNGFDLAVAGGRLSIRPAHQLTNAHRAVIRRYRDDLIILVQSCDPGVLSRRVLFKRQWTLDRTTTFLVCPDLGWERGRCFSCDDGLEAARFGRCSRCNLAWRWAAGVLDRLVDAPLTRKATGKGLVA